MFRYIIEVFNTPNIERTFIEDIVLAGVSITILCVIFLLVVLIVAKVKK